MEKSKAIDAKNAIEYSNGSVVSKTLIDKRSGSLTLFAFDKGQGLSEHTAPFDAFVYVIEGSAEITIANDKRRVKSGGMIIMPANAPHSLKAPERFKMLLAMVRS